MEWTCDTPKRLDSFLVEHNPEFSRARIQKTIESGGVKVNGIAVTKQALKLKEGDTVSLELAAETPLHDERIHPQDLALPLLYEDEFCVVVNKPAGIAVHPGTGMEDDEVTLLSGIAFLFEERGLTFTPGSVLVHRLDKDTTGCVLVAKTAEAHAALQKQFEERSVQKKYLAIVYGIPDPPHARIDAPIGRNLTDRTKMSVLRTSKSREAQTTYTTLDATNETALLQCDLHTGRTHQIRVHLRSISHPILGDTTYPTQKSEEYAKAVGVHTLCLHAWKLTFVSPSGSTVDLTCEPPQSFYTSLHATGLVLHV